MVLLVATVGGLAEEPLPIQGETVLASVNGEWITLDDLMQQVGTLHSGMDQQAAEAATGAVRTPDPTAFLDRMVNVQLVVQEARNIGLDELPEMTGQIATLRLSLLKEAVIAERTKTISEGDPAEVKRLVREAVREVQIGSVLFPAMESAQAFHDKVSAGEDFDALAARLLEDGTAKMHQEEEYLKASRLQPAVAGVTVFRLLDVRYPDDPEARAAAEREALAVRQQIDLADYVQELRERYLKIDQEVLDSLDYEAGPEALEKLRSDDRVVAAMEGGEPITVAELTYRLDKKIFHGIERAIEQKRANEEIPGVLDRIAQERATVLEAKRLGIEQRPQFRSTLRARTEGLLFGKFVSKVVDPSVKLTDEEVRAFYDEHASEYSTPHMMRLDSLIFDKRADAETGLEKLRQGADLNWMRANASGQVDPHAGKATWRFDGKILPVSGLPEGAQGALAGASTGDFRLWEESADAFHVLHVVQSVPSEVRDFEEVKTSVAGRVFADKRQQQLEHWIEQLRMASEIKIRVNSEELKDLLGLESGEGG
jgi:hypothetical protein